MGKTDVFSGVKAGMQIYDVFTQAVAEEIGVETTIALQSKVMEKIGKSQGNMMQMQAGIKHFNAQTTSPLVKTAMENLGLKIKLMKESKRTVLFRCTRCPIYDAGHELGIDQETIESWCRASSIRLFDTAIKQLNPDLTFRIVKFRIAPEDFCEEEMVEMIDLG
jgi:hypothetical protein